MEHNQGSTWLLTFTVVALLVVLALGLVGGITR